MFLAASGELRPLFSLLPYIYLSVQPLCRILLRGANGVSRILYAR